MQNAGIYAQSNVVATTTPFLMNFNQTLGTRPANDDTGNRSMSYTSFGLTPQLIVSDFKFGTGALTSPDTPALNLSSAVLETEVTTDLDCGGLTDYCMQGWIKLQAFLFADGTSKVYRVVDFAGTSLIELIAVRLSDTTYNLRLLVDTPTSTDNQTGSTVFNTGTYYETAISKIGNAFVLRVDGTAEASVNPGADQLATIGYQVQIFTFEHTMTIFDSMRVVRGCGVFNTDYTALTSELLEITSCPI